MNDSLLSTFSYNSTILYNLYNQINGKEYHCKKKSKYLEQRDRIISILKNTTNLTYKELSDLFKEYGIEMSYVQISRICSKFGYIEKESDKKGQKA